MLFVHTAAFSLFFYYIFHYIVLSLSLNKEIKQMGCWAEFTIIKKSPKNALQHQRSEV